MPDARVFALTSLAMLAFAGNSLLCRLALAHTAIDPASFTTIRLMSGAVMLSLAVRLRSGRWSAGGSWGSALALMAYAVGFSFAYVGLSAATGALLLPGLAAPPPGRAVLMLGAGVAWGVYSLRGQGAGEATAANAGNFLRAAPLALGLSLVMAPALSLDRAGVLYAVGSGALASGVGYAIWYAALPSLRSTTAAGVQRCVPALATLGGALLLDEPITARVLVASAAILGGIGAVVRGRRRA